MSDFSITTLGSISRIITGPFGSQLHQSDYVDSGHPLIMPQNISDRVLDFNKMAFISDEDALRLSRYAAKTNDIVYSRRGNVEKHAFITEAGSYCGTGCFLVRFVSDNVVPLYISYYLNLPESKQWLVQNSVGSNMMNLNVDILKSVPIRFPNRIAQISISNLLATFDCKISLNNAINAELESAARTLYDYWFTQFDFPNENGKPYKSSGGAMEYSKELKREIPKGWNVLKLANELDFKRGVEPGSGAYSDEISDTHTVPFIRVRDLGDKAAIFIQPEIADGYICTPSDVLVAFDGSVGKMSIGMNGCCSSGIRNIKPKSSRFSQAFIYLYFSGQEAQSTIEKYAVGSNILHAASSIEHFLFPYDEKTVRVFINRIEPMYCQMVANLQQNDELTELRDFLLPLLMNGQVRVATAETSAEVAAEEKPQTVAVKEPSKREAVFKRLVLSAYILDNICDEPTAGRVKFEKLLYLSEYCAKLPLHSEFQRAAAGPYDSKSLYSIESQLSQNKWFKRQKVTGESRAYTRLAKIDGYKQYVGTNLTAAQKTVIDKLIALFKTSRTIQCEIVATLYGAWNDFLLEGIQPTDDQIVCEVLTNWHEKKERISRDRWLKALQWMRSQEIIPVGYGVSTKGGNNA